MTDLTKDEHARNRQTEQHKDRRAAKRAKKGWKGRRDSPGDDGESRLGRIEGRTLAPAFTLSTDLVAVCVLVTEDVDPALFSASVRGLLDGQHKNVQVIVVIHGEPEGWLDATVEVLADDRVLRIKLDPDGEPNSAYAAAARLTRAPFIAFQGAHDESLPGRLADQLDAILRTGADACFTAARDLGARTLHHAGLDATVGFGELAPNTGLFRTDVVKVLGGIHPAAGGLRLLTSLVALLGRVATTKGALYVRNGDHLADEPGESTTELYETVFAAAGTSVGTAVQTAKAATLRARDRSISETPWHALGLGSWRGDLPSTRFVEAVLRLEFPDDRTARHEALDLLLDLATRKPDSVLVAAHSAAVLVAAIYGDASRSLVVGLEESAERAAQTRKLLDRLGLTDAQVRYAKLREQLVEPVGYVWHDFDPTEDFGSRLDYVYLDSSRCAPRHGALFHLSSVVGEGSRFRLTQGADLHRTLELWREHRHVGTTDLTGTVDVELVRDPESAEGIVVTVLTGSRPKLLLRTLKALARYDAQLVEQARVIVLVNGGDEASCDVAARFDWVDLVEKTPEVLEVSGAASLLMGLVDDGAEFVLHLEDDWECKGDGWRQRAVSLLRGDPGVAQVLVSTPHEGAPSINPVSGRRVSWEDARSPRGFRYRVGAAAYTLRPSLVRRTLAAELWPSTSEKEAMERFHKAGGTVARLHDAPFHHIGGDDSLRKKLGR